MLLLALAARLATTPGRRPVAFRLLIANLGATFAADMVFSVLALQGAATAVTDGGYLIAYLLLGASALHPSLPKLTGTSSPAPRARLGPGRLLAMGAAALVAPALLIYQRLIGADIQVAAIGGAWAVLFVLVMARMAGLVRGIRRSEAERRRLLDQTMHAAEQERIQIAAELHDGPIQRLSVLSYDLERAKQRVLANPTAVARLDHAQAALSTEVQGLRELLTSLRPPTLDEVGLEAALRDQVGAFTRHSGVECSVRVALAGRLDSELETIVYRVTQEALLNVTRHANASRLWLELEGVGDRVQLSIRDDGVGFDPKAGLSWSARPTSDWSPCGSGSSWPGGASSSTPARGAGAVVRATFTIPSAA